MRSPEKVGAVGSQASVEGIRRLGYMEWLMLRNHVEQYVGWGKKIDLVTLVGESLEDLWGQKV